MIKIFVQVMNVHFGNGIHKVATEEDMENTVNNFQINNSVHVSRVDVQHIFVERPGHGCQEELVAVVHYTK